MARPCKVHVINGLSKHGLRHSGFILVLITNDWESVLDEGISTGKTNWQMFGSRKPGHESYGLKAKFVCNYNENNNCWNIEKSNEGLDMRKMLSVLTPNHHCTEWKPNEETKLALENSQTSKPNKKCTKLKLKLK